MSSEAFSTQSLKKLYGHTLALQEISVSAPKKAVGLLGPNGAGKTTLIRVLMGIIPFNSGSATVLGRPMPASLNDIRDHVGYSPEFSPTMPDVSAQKYVTFMGRLSGLNSVEAAQRAHDTLHYVGLGEERYRRLGEYSTGMMQKCKLATALVHDPELLILDEPTDGLDPSGRHQMLELIKKLYVEEKKSIILSSHLLFDVQRVCDWVVILGRGRVIANGDVSQMLADSSGTVRLKVAGNPELLVSRLKSRGIDAASEGQYVDVQRTENVEMKVLEEIQKERSLGLRYLGPKTRTLEDVFMSLVEGRSDME
ncbi:MAG: hypothetical protein C4K47_01735 [Candidatus Thorarchaeota archaeon]|nr:MAG: hypothetical protein C4K47_01735 [Candidatus Thorarchaeota archaeon]